MSNSDVSSDRSDFRVLLQNKAWLEGQIAQHGVREIAAAIGCGPTTVQRAVKKHGIDTRAQHRAQKIAPLLGQRFGMLTVRAEAPPQARSGNARVHVDCDCGGTKITTVWILENKGSGWDHCGCQSKTRWAAQGHANRDHGHRRPTPSPTYRSWQAMRDRCYRTTTNGYKSFGGRGIQVCERWRDDFSAFLADMGERPDGKTLDRIDVDGNYEPDNCQWATPSEQIANRRQAVWLSAPHWKAIISALNQDGSTRALAARDAVLGALAWDAEPME